MGIKAGSIFVEILGKTRGLRTSLGQSQGMLSNFSSAGIHALGALTKIAAGVTLAVTGIGIASVKLASDFDLKMREVNTIARETGEGFNNMRKQVLNLSSQLGKDATQMAAALYQVQSAGYKGAAGLTVLRESVKLSIAGLAEMESVAKAVTVALDVWGLSSDDATKVTDEMFKTVELGIIKVENIAQGLGFVAANAQKVGMSFSELMATVATLTKAGIQNEKAFTGIRQILAAIITPSQEAKKAFEGIGVSARTIKKEGLIGVIQKIGKATEGDIEQIAKFIPNIRALTATLALGGNMMEKYQQNLIEIGDSAGATERAVEEINKSFSRFIEIYKTRFKNVLINVGDAVTPVIKSMADSFLKPENLLELSKGIVNFAEITIKAFANLPTIMGTIRVSFSSLQHMILRAQKGWILYQSATQLTRGHTQQLGEALSYVNGELAANETKQGDLIDSYAEIQAKVNAMLPNFDKLRAGIAAALVPGTEEATGLLGELDKIESKTKELGTTVTSVAEDLNDGIVQNRIEYARLGYEIKGGTVKLGPFADGIQKVAEETGEISVQAQLAYQSLGEMFGTMISSGGDAIQIIKKLIGQYIRLNLLKSLGPMGGIVGGFMQAFGFQHGGAVSGMPIIDVGRNVAVANENPSKPELILGSDNLKDLVTVNVISADPATTADFIIKSFESAGQSAHDRFYRGIGTGGQRAAIQRDGSRL